MAIHERGSSVLQQNYEEMKSSKQRKFSLGSNSESSRNLSYPVRKNSIWQRVKKTVSDSFSTPANSPTFNRVISSDIQEHRWKTKDDSILGKVKEPTAERWTPTLDGMRREHRRIISAVNSESILHFAVVENDVALLRSLLRSSNVDINAMRPPGTTPLHQACTSGNIECAKLLVKNGAKVNMSDWNGKSALTLAVCEGNFELAEFLIQNGATVDEIRDGFQHDETRSRSCSSITIRNV